MLQITRPLQFVDEMRDACLCSELKKLPLLPWQSPLNESVEDLRIFYCSYWTFISYQSQSRYPKRTLRESHKARRVARSLSFCLMIDFFLSVYLEIDGRKQIVSEALIKIDINMMPPHVNWSTIKGPRRPEQAIAPSKGCPSLSIVVVKCEAMCVSGQSSNYVRRDA